VRFSQLRANFAAAAGRSSAVTAGAAADLAEQPLGAERVEEGAGKHHPTGRRCVLISHSHFCIRGGRIIFL